ncbi:MULTISPECIES: hypothetical protein [unclassified Endozoicomonas]|uniref:hypothetical protein n=1 Tax=unclassified Endozoicomonas TaxID=2644528 RepID=UPI003BB77743
MSIVFTRQDRNLYDVLNQATEDELLLLSKIIGDNKKDTHFLKSEESDSVPQLAS